MEIPDIKAQLTLARVLHFYGLKPDKHLRLCCPFHEDKTPSLQVYYKTQTCYCFSSNCRTHGRSMDVIDFVMQMENGDKHHAILKCQDILGYYEGKVQRVGQPLPTEEEHQENTTKDLGVMNPTLSSNRSQFLSRMFTYFKNAVHNSEPARNYISSRGLDSSKIVVGYNTGQFHHGTRKDEGLIQQCLQYGLLSSHDRLSRTGELSYKPFAKYGIVFALKDKEYLVTGLYFRSTINNEEQKHFYLKGSTGLYPGYPKQETEKLIITESIIDAASLVQIKALIDEYSILAAYGTNRLNDEMKTAITELPQLQEIIFAFDSDDAGNKAAAKYKEELQVLLPQVKFTTLQLPCKDVNETLTAHSEEVFELLLQERTADFSFSIEKKEPSSAPELFIDTPEPLIPPEVQPLAQPLFASRLDATNPEQIHYHTDELLITLLGGISLQNLDRLRVTIYMRRNPHLNPSYSIRQTVDLYQDDLVEKFIRRAAEKLELPTTMISEALAGLTESAEGWRLSKLEAQKTEKPRRMELTPLQVKQAEDRLRNPALMQWTMDAYARTGIIGELTNAMILHVCMSGRGSEEPVSVICLSASGTGKSYLLERVAACFPAEDIIENTQMTENSFYYFKRDGIKGKIFLIEDMDGAASVEYPIRELITKKRISKTVTLKDSKGNLRTITLTVEGPVTFCGCTTKERLYEDNANRSLLIDLDSTREQDARIMDYHKRVRAGLIDKSAEQDIRLQLQQMQCLLRPLRVINPYATVIELPQDILKPRRTLSLLLSFIESITLYHQYQCERRGGAIVTRPEHIEWAFKLLREVLFRKSDELSGALRSFLEALKVLLAKEQKTSFHAAEIRKPMRLTPRTLSRYLYELQQYGYIRITGGNKYRRGYEYEITPGEDSLGRSMDSLVEQVMNKVWLAYKGSTSKATVGQLATVGQNGVGALNPLS